LTMRQPAICQHDDTQPDAEPQCGHVKLLRLSMPQPTESPATTYAPINKTTFFLCCPVMSSNTLSTREN
jgi:hypothetical protein